MSYLFNPEYTPHGLIDEQLQSEAKLMKGVYSPEYLKAFGKLASSRSPEMNEALNYPDRPKLKFDTDATGIGTGIVQGLGNAVNNYQALKDYRVKREMLGNAVLQVREREQKQVDMLKGRETARYNQNFEAALNDDAYGKTPEERRQNALRDAANDWSYMGEIQKGRATSFTAKETDRNKEETKLETFRTRRDRFREEQGFDPFNDDDMKDRKFSPAQINAFRQYFPGEDFADELTTMERKLKHDQAEANLEGARARTERTQGLTYRTSQTPIPQPKAPAGPKQKTKAQQVYDSYTAGDISPEEYKQWQLSGGKGSRPPVARGSGFHGTPKPAARPAATPTGGSGRVEKFSSRFGF